jgi:hypothetical protein
VIFVISGSIIKCLTTKWTDKLYSHLPKTFYDEIVDYVKVNLVNCYTNVGIIKGLPIDDCLGACTIFKQVAENDESFEKVYFIQIASLLNLTDLIFVPIIGIIPLLHH